MKKIIVATAFLGLAACGPTDAEKAYVRENLPDGCAIRDLGGYGEITRLIVVVCDGRPTQSSNWSWTTQCGKARCRHEGASVVVGRRA